jgi:hypothetical protein
MRKDWDWAAIIDKLPLCWTDNTTGVVAVDLDTGALVGAFVCEAWTLTTVQAHFVIWNKAALRHGFIYQCSRYVYDMGGRQKVLATIPADNDKALCLNRHMGFKELVRIENGFRVGCDAVIMEMHKDDCRYYRQPEELKEAC